jgi:hypothetical protein
VIVRDLLTQLSDPERDALTSRVQALLLAAQLIRHAVTEPDATRETVEGLYARLTLMIEEAEALRAMLSPPASRELEQGRADTP